MEIIKEKVCMTSYKGKCPECSRKQESGNRYLVDVLCYPCKEKIAEKDIKKILVGTVITDFVLDGTNLEGLVLEKDGQKVKIFCKDGEHGLSLEYKTIKDKAKPNDSLQVGNRTHSEKSISDYIKKGLRNY